MNNENIYKKKKKKTHHLISFNIILLAIAVPLFARLRHADQIYETKSFMK